MALLIASDLRKAMNERDLQAGYQLLRGIKIKPNDLKSDYALLYELSRWLTHLPEFRSAVQTALDSVRVSTAMTLADLIHFRLAEAFTALAARDRLHAEEGARKALALGEGCRQDAGNGLGDYLMASAYFCLASALRFAAKYGEALDACEKSSALLKKEAPKLAAVVDLHRHWFLLQMPHDHGSYQVAKAILQSAEETLRGTTDFNNQAYVEYLRGRSLRFQGEYDQAIQALKTAETLYERDAKHRQDRLHRMVLRVLTNQARTFRLKAGRVPAMKGNLLANAADALKRAEDYALELAAPPEELVRIWIERGYLAIEQGNIRAGFRKLVGEIEGKLDEDHVMRARFNLLRFWHSYAILSRDLGDPRQLTEAPKFAEAAYKHATQTENRRIRVRAEVAMGLAAMARFKEQGADTARRHLREADFFLNDEDLDYVREEFGLLARKVGTATDLLVFSFTIDKLMSTTVNTLIEEEIKPRIIRWLMPHFDSARAMRDKTGLAWKTVAEYWKEQGK